MTAQFPSLARAPISSAAVRPRVSVIISMADHRETGSRAVESWVAAQRCDRDLFEVIVLVGPKKTKLERALRGLVHANDRIVTIESGNEMKQFHRGAELARGDILFFCEPHCIAEPDNISETLKFMEDDVIDGFVGHSTSIWSNDIARFENLFHDEVCAKQKRSGRAMVSLRAFAIRKEVYFASGGFQFQYGLFAEYLLAATLHRQGHRIGHTPRVVVGHVGNGSFAGLAGSVDNFVEGECLYRATNQDPDFCAEFFGNPSEWEIARTLHISRAAAVSFILGFIRSFGRGRVSSRRAATAAGRRAAPFSRGLRLRLYFWWQVWAAKIEFYRAYGDESRRYRAYSRVWESLARYARVRWALAKFGRGREVGLAGAAPFGFHGPEKFDGTNFRWSAALAGIKLPVSPDRYRVVFGLRPIRSIEKDDGLIFCMNRKIIEPKPDPALNEVWVDIEPHHFAKEAGEWLFFSVSPWPKAIESGDSRHLGIAVSEIRVEPAASGSTPREVVWRCAL